ncbi:glutaredoxin family protein [Deinococcus enclensis]|jgi:glutaredoxin|uniref:Glutaredoxin n=1 Tax=Deinococcus enclensis TaxID=1049582 RepID=A0ABT9M8Q0_9DEIO|nr:glutaredoxin family protein [Deinococcus enclensis]MDP9762952.1 glutaredoxin [Deinococcus enclensis]
MSGAALPTLTLYSKPGCRPCEIAKANLEALAFAFEVVNIESAPALMARYGQDIPVLALRRDPHDPAQDEVLGKGALTRTRLGTLKLLLMRRQGGPDTATP